MTKHRLTNRSAVVYIASDGCFVQLDKPTDPHEVWFKSYKDIPTDRTIISTYLSVSQKEIALAHVLLLHPTKLQEVYRIVIRHKLSQENINETYLG